MKFKLKMYTHQRPGILITFCGLDGCGKSTQLTMLKTWFQKKGLPVQITKQPTDTVRKSNIFRTYMDEPDHDAFNYRSLSLLCASDRIQHCSHVILPVLETGGIVLSDRYYYSCLANLRARGYTKDRWIYEMAQSIPKPDLAVFLDVPVDLAVARVHARAAERNRYIDMDLQYRLRDEYLKIARKNGALLLDSSKSPDETFNAITAAADRLGKIHCLSGAMSQQKDKHTTTASQTKESKVNVS